MVQPFLPNEADAFNANQAEPDSVDFEILLLGYERTGVVSGCAVTESSPAAQTVDVAVGVAILAGSQITVAVQADVAVTAADGTNPRFDLITVNSSGTVVVTAGTAAAQPVLPAIPATSVPLAALYIPTSDNTHADNQINDKRVIVPSPVVPIRFVDPNGADTNDGRTELTAFATIQAAYDDLAGLVTNVFAGEIHLLPGVHDVGAGLAFNGLEGVNLVGVPSTLHGNLNADARAVITTNNTATEHIDVTAPGGLSNGFEFRHLTFDMDGTLLTAAIRMENPVHTLVERCTFFATTNPVVGCWALEFDNSGVDNSFNSILYNRMRGVGLLKILISGNSNVNRWNIEGNACFWADDTNWMIDAVNLATSRIAGNNLEGAAGGVWLRGGDQNTCIGNGGEGVGTGVSGHANAYYRLGDSVGSLNANENIIIGGWSGFGGAAVTTGIWVRFESGFTADNLIVHAGLVDSTVTSNDRNHIEDATTGGAGNTIFGLDSWLLSSKGLTLPERTADPAVLVDGMLWHRSDTLQLVAQVDGATRTLGLQEAIEVGTITLDWTHGIVSINSAGGIRVVTLPDADDFDGKNYLIRRRGGNRVDINAVGADDFSDGDTTKTLDSDGAAIGIFSVGVGEWMIVGTEGTVGGS